MPYLVLGMLTIYRMALRVISALYNPKVTVKDYVFNLNTLFDVIGIIGLIYLMTTSGLLTAVGWLGEFAIIAILAKFGIRVIRDFIIPVNEAIYKG